LAYNTPMPEPLTNRPDGIFSLAPEGSVSIPPELFRVQKTRTSSDLNWIVNPDDVGLSLGNWQSDPSRIIYHDGRYHMWMIDLDRTQCAEAHEWNGGDFFATDEGRNFRPAVSRILYLTSEDTHQWTAHGHLPLGPEGSCWDLLLEQVNVVYHEGRFYMFTEVWTTNAETYGNRVAGVACLTADSPEGPWSPPPGAEILITPKQDDTSWDGRRVLNPRHVHLGDKWLMYFKGGQGGMRTHNGLAVADSITGPYEKVGDTPLLAGHGHFCWRYKHGLIMMPNHDYEDESGERWLHWSEDGVHFAPILKSDQVFMFGALYVPNDPLFGEPQSDQTPTTLWGFETIKSVNGRDFDVERIEWTIG
jgi:hypothetical protein